MKTKKRKPILRSKKVVKKIQPEEKLLSFYEIKKAKNKPEVKETPLSVTDNDWNQYKNSETPQQMTETKESEVVQFDLEKNAKPAVTETPLNVSTNTDSQKVNTLTSQSMMDDLLQATDKDNEDEHESDFNYDMDEPETAASTSSASPGEKSFGEKFNDTITSEGEDWENVADFKKMCSINAMMYVEGGSIFLSFIAQLISGDWSPEGEKKYMPSEERRKLIRNPLAKKMELSKNRKRSSPIGAMVTAIIFTILPIIIIAFKDRKAKVDKELKEIEANKLRDELEKSNAVISQLRNQINNITPQTQPAYSQPSNFHRVEKRGRHKKDCDCDKCILTRMKTKKKRVKA